MPDVPAPEHLLDIVNLDGSPWANPAFDTSTPDWSSKITGGKTYAGSDDPKFEWVSVLHSGVEQDDEVGLAGTAVNPNPSDKDLQFTHPFGPDFEFTIVPDPAYTNLLAAANKDPHDLRTYGQDWAKAVAAGIPVPAGLLGVEIDGALVPPAYRVEEGDRVAVYGRWIVDAGHAGFHTEIHPPLLMAYARSVDDTGKTTAPSQGATTLLQLWSRPYQAGQTFSSSGDSGLNLHDYITDIAVTAGDITASPPIFPLPFDGIHVVCFKIRPPVQLSPPKLATAPTPKLECSYHFTVNGACGVQIIQPPSEPQSVLVALALNSVEYPALQAPQRYSKSISIDDLLAEAPAGVNLNWIQQVWADIKKVIIFRLCEAPHMSQTQDQVNVVPFTPLDRLPDSSHGLDQNQPFPVYGWLKLRWAHLQTTARVVYRGTDNHIHELWYRPGQPGGWQTGDLTQLVRDIGQNAPDAAGDPAAYITDFDDTARVVYRGTDNHIHELWYRPGQRGGWQTGDLTQLVRDIGQNAPDAAGDPAAYITDFDDTARVVYRGTGPDNHIHELWYRPGQPGGWQTGDLTQLVRDIGQNAPDAAGDPAAYITDFDDTARVVYRGTGPDNHIHELWYRPGQPGGWQTGDLTQLVRDIGQNAPDAAGDPAAYITDFDDTARVVYRGTGPDNHIHELWYRPGQPGGWQTGDLTQLVRDIGQNAPDAAGDPAAYITDFDDTARVVYRGTGPDNHIHELWYRPGQPGGWQTGDLTQLVRDIGQNAPDAAGDPAAYITDFDDTARVVYRGTGPDNHIHELWYRPGQPGGWQTGDLTQLVRDIGQNAPDAAGGPAAYITDF